MTFSVIFYQLCANFSEVREVHEDSVPEVRELTGTDVGDDIPFRRVFNSANETVLLCAIDILIVVLKQFYRYKSILLE